MTGLNWDILGVTLILLATLYLLISEKIAVDKTAIGIIVMLSLTGILDPKEAVAGFANPAVITVGAMFLISRGLIRTGGVGFITELVLALSRGNRNRAFVFILVTVALASAFINNTPVVVLFIPIVMGLSCECDFSPSTLLIPVSYVSILAGTCTLIGTSTNIIVSDLSAAHGYEALAMFELSALGVPIALAGLVYLLFLSPRLMPERVGPVCELDNRQEKLYIAELQVIQGSGLIGETDIMGRAETEWGFLVIEVIRSGTILDPARTPLEIREDDILLVKGSAESLVTCLQKQQTALAHGEEGIGFTNGMADDLIVELIVPPLSQALREPLLSNDLLNDPGVQIIAIRSRQSHYSYRKIHRVRLKIGDMVLVRCPRNKLDKLRRETDFIIVEDIHHAIIDREKAKIAIFIFGGVVLAATTGLASIMVSALAGVFCMTLTHCLALKDAYRSLEAEVLMLIVGTIALGAAMEKTGASGLYADLFLGVFQGLGPPWILAGMILLASVATHILSNNATAVLLVPVALSTAQTLGVDPRPFIIGICFGASACYATPIGYQTNLLVYGPGGYRFGDYLKLGLPLNLMVVILSALFIPVLWPF